VNTPRNVDADLLVPFVEASATRRRTETALSESAGVDPAPGTLGSEWCSTPGLRVFGRFSSGHRMSSSKLAATLLGLPPGQGACLHHEVFARIFPPGISDENAKALAQQFAKAYGCVLEDAPEQSNVRFRKPDKNSA
jgi:hypothetical protein